MSPDSYKRFCASLSQLTEAQRGDLKRRLSALTSELESRSSAASDWLLQGLLARLQERGLLSDAALPLLLRSKGLVSYRRISVALQRDLLQLLSERQRGDRVLRRRLSYVVCDALCLQLSLQRVPLSASVVLLHASKAFEALEASYPSYVASGLFSAVLLAELTDNEELR